MAWPKLVLRGPQTRGCESQKLHHPRRAARRAFPTPRTRPPGSGEEPDWESLADPWDRRPHLTPPASSAAPGTGAPHPGMPHPEHGPFHTCPHTRTHGYAHAHACTGMVAGQWTQSCAHGGSRARSAPLLLQEALRGLRTVPCPAPTCSGEPCRGREEPGLRGAALSPHLPLQASEGVWGDQAPAPRGSHHSPKAGTAWTAQGSVLSWVPEGGEERPGLGPRLS